MAEAKKEVPKKEEAKKEVAYFRCIVHPGLATPVGKREDGSNEHVRFTAYYDKWKGDTIKVGYLETDNKRAIDVFRNDLNVEEIDEKEYKLSIEGDGKRNKPLKRAPLAAI